MDQQLYSVDRERLRFYRERRGFTAKGLARRAEVSLGYVRQLEECVVPPIARIDRVLRICDALDIGQEAIIVGDNPNWHPVHWSEVATIAGYLGELEQAKDVLTCTQGLDGYITRGHEDFTWDSLRLRKVGWSESDIAERQASAKAYIQEQVKLREDGGFRHRVICGERIFTELFRINPEWSETCINSIKTYEGDTLLGIVPACDWPMLEAHVSKLVPGGHKWDKLLLVDLALAMFRPDGEYFMFTRHLPTIQKLRHGLEGVTVLSRPDISSLCQASGESRAKTLRWTRERIKEIAHRVESACDKGTEPRKKSANC